MLGLQLVIGLLLVKLGVAHFINDEHLWREVATHALFECGGMGSSCQVGRQVCQSSEQHAVAHFQRLMESATERCALAHTWEGF